MKRKILGFFLVAGIFSLMACTADDNDEESLRERCQIEPQLPECQELPAQDDPTIPSGLEDDSF